MGTRSWLGLWLLPLLAASACAAHVQLRAPPPTAPLAARQRAYAALRPKRATTMVNPGNGCLTFSGFGSMQLADGQWVDHGEDLLPVVPPGSACALALGRYQRAERVEHTLEWVGLPLELGGVVTMVEALRLPTKPGLTVLSVGASMLVVGLVTDLVARLGFWPAASSALRQAFENYDAALQSRLHIRQRLDLEVAPATGSGPATGPAPGTGH